MTTPTPSRPARSDAEARAHLIDIARQSLVGAHDMLAAYDDGYSVEEIEAAAGAHGYGGNFHRYLQVIRELQQGAPDGR